MVDKSFDLSAYLVIGPECTLGRSLEKIVGEALDAGFSFVQLRSKTASAKDQIAHSLALSELIAAHPRRESIKLLVNDRLDVALAARAAGARIDGVHLGQDDIPPEVCRAQLGPDAIIGLTVTPEEMDEELKKGKASVVDYFGTGPMHPSPTKKDCGVTDEGRIRTLSVDELKDMVAASSRPIVVGGGIGASDLPALAQSGVDGFFVVSAVASADKPGQAAAELVAAWHQGRGGQR